MIARASGYSGHLFKGYRGVTQGDPLYPKIFNVVVIATTCHWVKVVIPTEAGMGGLGLTIINLMAYLYADNGFIALIHS